jgi:hypothetical protein
VSLPRNLRAPVARSPKWPSLYFRSPPPSEGSSRRVTVVEPTGCFLLRVYGPYRCLRDGYGILVCRLRSFACRVLHRRPPSPSSVTSSIPPPPWQERRPLRTKWRDGTAGRGIGDGVLENCDELTFQAYDFQKGGFLFRRRQTVTD